MTAAEKTDPSIKSAAAPALSRIGRGHARPENLDPGATALLDDQAARAAARRERLRAQAKLTSPTGKSQFCQRLIAARAYASCTQKQLAEVLGVTRAAIALWESEDPGVRTTPKLDQVKATAAFLRVPVDYFMNDEIEARDIWQYVEAAKAGAAHGVGGTGVRPTQASQDASMLDELARMIELARPQLSDMALELGKKLDQVSNAERRRDLFLRFMTVLDMELLPVVDQGREGASRVPGAEHASDA